MKTLSLIFFVLLFLFFSPNAFSQRATPNDFDGDGQTDYSVFRPSNGVWHISTQAGTYIGIQFGLNGDIPVPEDFDGDRKADIAVWRNGVFHLLLSSRSIYFTIQFGTTSDDPTVCRDYDGDGFTDLAVYRRGSGSAPSTWFIWQSSNYSVRQFQLGTGLDVPAPGDYDGDGKVDPAVFYSTTSSNLSSYFLVLQSSTNVPRQTFWGGIGDVSIPGDYDNDGITDFAIWRPREIYPSGPFDGLILILTAKRQVMYTQWGGLGDKPVPGDYNGDGATDFAVWRPDNRYFYVLTSSGQISYRQWGAAGDIPTAGYLAH